MGAPMVVPFDNNPVAVSVKTASYTVPVGKFIRAYVECDSGGIFTINGVNAVVTAAFANIDLQGTSATPITHSVPTGFRSVIAAFSDVGSGAFTVNGNTPAGASPTTPNQNAGGFELGPGGSFAVAAGALGQRTITGVSIPSQATNRQAEFYLPAGTIINGSGNWKAVVMEYNVIS